MTGGTNGLEAATRGATDRKYIYFREAAESASSTPVRVAQNFLHNASQEWDINRFQVRNDTGLKMHDDFLGDVIADQWGTQVGSDPQCAAAATLAGAFGGQIRMTTGDDATGDMATNGTQLESALNWNPIGGGLAIEFRIKVNAITNVAMFLGFTDQVGTLEMPFTLGASDALTSNATNAVGVLFDTGADTDNWWLVGVKADSDATHQNSAVAPTAATFETWRVEVTSAGAASFYRNGAVIGSAMSNAITANVALTPVIAAFSRAAASRNVEIDYIHVECNRF
jgi:hypothetical protein